MKSEILLSITGKNPSDWQNKLKEINSKKIKRVALFLEFFNKTQRKKNRGHSISVGNFADGLHNADKLFFFIAFFSKGKEIL